MATLEIKQENMGVYSMKKGEFIEYITKQTGESRQNTDRFYKAFCKGIEEQLRNGDELCLTGIGTFRIKKRQARKGINPQTKERINRMSLYSSRRKVLPVV